MAASSPSLELEFWFIKLYHYQPKSTIEITSWFIHLEKKD